MYEHYSYLKYFLNSLNNPPEDIGKLLYKEKYVISRKGYGTPELEMRFLHKVFLYIRASISDLESISWEQSNCYNDNYYHIELTSFTLNEKVDIDSDITFFFESYEDEEMKSNLHFGAIDYPDPEEIEYAKEHNLELGEYGLDEPHWDAFAEHRKKKYQHLEKPCLKFIAFLKLLEINYSMYYFLYTFGNGVKVKFDKEGVTVTKLDENEIDGQPLGTGMYLDDF